MPLSTTTNNAKPRNPLSELPLTDYSQPGTPSSSSASASGLREGRTPSSVSSFLSSGSTSTSGSGAGTSGSGRSGREGRSGRIVHLALPDLSYPSAPSPSSSRRTVRPATAAAATSNTQPLGETATTRRWPARPSSPSGMSLTPGRLPPYQQQQHAAGMAASSPLRPRAIGATPASVEDEDRKSRRAAMMRELVDESEDDEEEDAEMDVPVQGGSMSGDERISQRERESRAMPPPPPPLPPPIHPSPSLLDENGMTPRPVRHYPSVRGTESSLTTPARSPARRLFTTQTATQIATPPQSTTGSVPEQRGTGGLQPSPPFAPTRADVDVDVDVDADADADAGGCRSTARAGSEGKTKPRARTSTGRDSPPPQQPPLPPLPPLPPSAATTDLKAQVPETAGEPSGKKARLSDPTQQSSAHALPAFIPPTATTSSTSTGPTTSAAAAAAAAVEEQLKKRLENLDPHDCGFTVWQDTSRGARLLVLPPTISISAGASGSGSGGTASVWKGKGVEGAREMVGTVLCGAGGTMAEKNKAGFAWLSSIASSSSATSSASSPATASGSGTNSATENQENIKPSASRSRLVPFLLAADGKGLGKGTTVGAAKGGGGAGTTCAMASGSGTSLFTSTSVSAPGTNTAATTSILPPPPPSVSLTRTPAAQLPRLLVPLLHAGRAELSIRSSMRGSVPPLSASNIISTTSTAAGAEGSALTGGTTSRSAPVETTSSTTRPVLVLRRTGSADNVNTLNGGGGAVNTVDISMTNACSGTVKSTAGNKAPQEQENDTASLVIGTGVEKQQKRAPASGRKKRKSEEMMLSSTFDGTDGSSPVKKKPSQSIPITTNGQPSDGSLVQNRARERRAARRSLGGNSSSGSLSGSGRDGGREKKPGRKMKGKSSGDDGYQGRVLRSMTRAGNGL